MNRTIIERSNSPRVRIKQLDTNFQNNLKNEQMQKSEQNRNSPRSVTFVSSPSSQGQKNDSNFINENKKFKFKLTPDIKQTSRFNKLIKNDKIKTFEIVDTSKRQNENENKYIEHPKIIQITKNKLLQADDIKVFDKKIVNQQNIPDINQKKIKDQNIQVFEQKIHQIQSNEDSFHKIKRSVSPRTTEEIRNPNIIANNLQFFDQQNQRSQKRKATIEMHRQEKQNLNIDNQYMESQEILDQKRQMILNINLVDQFIEKQSISTCQNQQTQIKNNSIIYDQQNSQNLNNQNSFQISENQVQKFSSKGSISPRRSFRLDINKNSQVISENQVQKFSYKGSISPCRSFRLDINKYSQVISENQISTFSSNELVTIPIEKFSENSYKHQSAIQHNTNNQLQKIEKVKKFKTVNEMTNLNSNDELQNKQINTQFQQSIQRSQQIKEYQDDQSDDQNKTNSSLSKELFQNHEKFQEFQKLQEVNKQKLQKTIDNLQQFQSHSKVIQDEDIQVQQKKIGFNVKRLSSCLEINETLKSNRKIQRAKTYYVDQNQEEVDIVLIALEEKRLIPMKPQKKQSNKKDSSDDEAYNEKCLLFENMVNVNVIQKTQFYFTWKKPIVIIDLIEIFALTDWSMECFSYEYEDFKDKIKQSFLDGTQEFLTILNKQYSIILKIPAYSRCVEYLISVVIENFKFDCLIQDRQIGQMIKDKSYILDYSNLIEELDLNSFSQIVILETLPFNIFSKDFVQPFIQNDNIQYQLSENVYECLRLKLPYFKGIKSSLCIVKKQLSNEQNQTYFEKIQTNLQEIFNSQKYKTSVVNGNLDSAILKVIEQHNSKTLLNQSFKKLHDMKYYQEKDLSPQIKMEKIQQFVSKITFGFDDNIFANEQMIHMIEDAKQKLQNLLIFKKKQIDVDIFKIIVKNLVQLNQKLDYLLHEKILKQFKKQYNVLVFFQNSNNFENF